MFENAAGVMFYNKRDNRKMSAQLSLDASSLDNGDKVLYFDDLGQ